MSDNSSLNDRNHIMGKHSHEHRRIRFRDARGIQCAQGERFAFEVG